MIFGQITETLLLKSLPSERMDKICENKEKNEITVIDTWIQAL